MASARAGVLGAGYVGLTSAACLAHLGHRVRCVDIDEAKVAALARGEVGIAEPGLSELVRDGLATGLLEFGTGRAILSDAELVLLCLPTPRGSGDGTDLGALESAVAGLAAVLAPGCVLVTKSTVPVGTTERMPWLLGRGDLPAVSNPEFLRESHAVHDFLHPERIVVGARDVVAGDRVAGLYRDLDAPVVRTDPASAELAKYASNAFLAMRLSYVNGLAELCEHFGADIAAVTGAMGLDSRIGADFLAPGPGWGGSCLPKDTGAMLRAANEAGMDFGLLRATVEMNARQRDRVVAKVCAAAGRPDERLDGVRIGLLGLAFKAGTGDLRDSPALAVAEELAARGAILTGHDPGVPASEPAGPVHVVDDPAQVAKDAAVLVLLTEWPEYRCLDWAGLAELADGRTVVDTRNLLDPRALARHGFHWSGVGVSD
jgi:UDPglucose 6-dehydrogenase